MKKTLKFGSFLKWLVGSFVLSMIATLGHNALYDSMAPRTLYFYTPSESIVEEIQFEGKMNSVTRLQYRIYVDMTDFTPDERAEIYSSLDSEYGYVSQYKGFSYSSSTLPSNRNVLELEISVDPSNAYQYDLRTVLYDVMGLTYEGTDFSEVTMISWRNGLKKSMTQRKQPLSEQDVLSILNMN